MLFIPSHVVNSVSLALGALTNESEIIMGVKAKSHPYLRTNSRKGSLFQENNNFLLARHECEHIHANRYSKEVILEK